MLGVLTAIVLSVGSIQATMVLPEQTRLAAEDAREPLVIAPGAYASIKRADEPTQPAKQHED